MHLQALLKFLRHPFQTIENIIEAKSNLIRKDIKVQTFTIFSRQLSEQVNQLSDLGISSNKILGKNIVISIRKPILELAKIGSCQIWQST